MGCRTCTKVRGSTVIFDLCNETIFVQQLEAPGQHPRITSRSLRALLKGTICEFTELHIHNI